MKKTYETPNIQIDIIDENDVITLSVQASGSGDWIDFDNLFGDSNF